MIKQHWTYGLTFFILTFNLVQAQDSPPEIEVTHNQKYCLEAPISIVNSVTISDADSSDSNLDEVFIQISEGYVQGQDVLTLGGITPNISSSWSASEGLLTLTGTATFSEYETAIENVFFSTTQTVFSSDRSISINLGSANFLPSTGHYYFYVSSPGISWTQARAEAESQTYFGLQGYLVTITSIEEAQLSGEQSPGTGWIGATDADVEGTWQWVTGPEAGEVFWIGQFNGGPPNNEYSFWNCAEPNNFQGNEDYAHITDNSVAGCSNNSDPNFIGAWNDLPNIGEQDSNSPYYPRGYIVEFGGFPGEPDINLSASSVIQMPQVDLTSQNVCRDDTIEISLDGNADDYLWFDSPSSTNPIFIGDTYSPNITINTTYWISPRFGGCSIGGRQPLNVFINDIPQANSQVVSQCDNEGDTDGITEFNLSSYDEVVIEGNTEDVIVRHFEDASLTLSINSDSYENQFNGQIIYAQVQNIETSCYKIAEIQLNVVVPATNTAFLEVCDDLPEDGFSTFDLSMADDQVISDPSLGLVTSYFESYNDALLQINELPTNFRNTIPNQQIIYVRLQEGNDCFGINEVFLTVRALPQIEPDETVYYCLNTFPETIVLDGGVLNDIPNNYYYQWSTGETTIAIEVNEPGTYTVEITEVNGCSNTRTITVEATEIATIESINVLSQGETSTATIITNGQGSYSYSLDDLGGPYQISNVFEEVYPGVRTVYVKDELGNCGIVSQDFSVVGFPKFFTPNGDGQNDFWKVSGFNSEFLFNSKVQIFDRYGKLLVELNSENSAWDGRYQGQLMPSSDYWFKTTLEDGREHIGHFTLKR